MARILITPEEVEQVAQQFKAKREESSQIINVLNQQIQGLEGQWDGMTKQRFFQDFQEARKNMENFVHLLDNISQALTQIATKFRQTDQV
ncbi:WXG100 family type VII secretion target [Paenactinomyces guangxiensis]|uniref:WXG100 family type VII secretion target n=1 Tax=Paenactinomyces guangxiensis TaxID=1490290 RepID=A0A7W1WUQ9_9BACL|nr:WXG100 family type VII secretion target [Paenactinomyces guangxiensis]MBA4496409.1 WXG100 family type VII secretion target [Paenactinomyces guangxiensis]MBH8593480.1 WXG100 family type VII secretion target [Paenactinomyces guangxiensis]